MNFSFSGDQEEIRDLASKIFRDLCDDETIRSLYKEPQAFHGGLWSQLAESGLLAAPLPQQYGGSALGLTEICLVLEGQGASVAPIPLLETIVECALVIAEYGSETMKQSVLPGIAEGRLRLSSVRPYRGFRGKDRLTAASKSKAWILTGESALVSYAPLADGFVVEAVDEHGDPWIAYVEAKQKGVNITQQKSVSGEVCGHINFNAVAVDKSKVLAHGDKATELIEWQAQRTYIALAARQVGVLQEGLRRAAEYTKERRQFGKALAAFQAVSQQAADAYMAIEALRGVYWRALGDIELLGEAALSAKVAKFWTAEAGHIAAHISLHVHGGIGQDLDYPAHRFFLWAKQNENYLGGSTVFAAELGKKICANVEAFTS